MRQRFQTNQLYFSRCTLLPSDPPRSSSAALDPVSPRRLFLSTNKSERHIVDAMQLHYFSSSDGQCAEGIVCKMLVHLALLVIIAFASAAASPLIFATGDILCANGATCSSSQTCVPHANNASDKYACSPFPNAVVCDDYRFSCPENHVCNLSNRSCDSAKGSVALASNGNGHLDLGSLCCGQECDITLPDACSPGLVCALSRDAGFRYLCGDPQSKDPYNCGPNCAACHGLPC